MRRAALLLALAAAPPAAPLAAQQEETARVLTFEPGVTVTLVAPAVIDPRERIDLILYALPNGNTTAETMGRAPREGLGWRYDIQHIAAQTRALRERGYRQAVVAYLEADTKSWPAWRARLGYAAANARIVEIVDGIRAAVGRDAPVVVTLTGHSGGGSFMFGFIDGRAALPSWLERIAFLDANYSFEPRHAEPLLIWLRGDAARRLVVLAYDDREIMLDGKKVVSDSGGTWRATDRMITAFAAAQPPVAFGRDTVGAFQRLSGAGIELLRHPNPANRILHTEMIGEMNGYMHALLAGRPGYGDANTLLQPARAYARFVAP